MEIYKCSPSGNITSLVFSPVPRNEQSSVAQDIMKNEPDVEQVGFIEKPTSSGSSVRLQMMGGEFCGNATSALAWVLSKKSGFSEGIIEVSGKSEPVFASIKDSEVILEFNERIFVTQTPFTIPNKIIHLEGISHLIVDSATPIDFVEESRRLISASGLKEKKAAGIIFVEYFKGGIKIRPFVWVRDTGTFVQENGCASGSICSVLWESMNQKKDLQNYCVFQPSGAEIYVSSKIISDNSASIQIRSKVTILNV